MKKYILFAFLLFVWRHSGAQNLTHNSIWTFGHHAGLDFNNNTVTPITDSIFTESACASVTSNSGNLLFYTDGEKIWNRNHQVMPNGSGLLGNKDASILQGALIVPVLNDTNKYYVFSLKDFSTSNEDDLHYSIVDLSLNNGLGDVVTNQKNIWVSSGNSNSMAAVPGNACNIWLVTHLRDTNVFKVYEITASGINLSNPIVSTIGNWSGSTAYQTSIMKVSPNRQKIALSNFSIYNDQTHPEENISSSLELFSFDPSNGQVSNVEVIDETMDFFYNFLALEFSPDGTKLYGSAPFMALMGSQSVFQYDLTQPSPLAIQNSKIPVGSPTLVGDIRRAPDGKIYVAASWGTPGSTLDRIDDPNLAGAACNYTAAAITLQPGTYSTTMFPTPVVYPVQDTYHISQDTIMCKSGSITIPIPAGYSNYNFQGTPLTTSTITIDQPGSYFLSYSNQCEYFADSIHVVEYHFNAELKDTALCGTAFELTLNASGDNPAGTNYIWQDGSTGPDYTVREPGTYFVTMNKSGCLHTDSIQVKSLPLPEFSIGNDTTICIGDNITLEGSSADSYRWQDGSTLPSYKVKTAGEYILTATIDGCSSSDTLNVATVDCDCHIFIPNAFSPNGDGINDQFSPRLDCGPSTANFQISIFNRYGQRVFYSIDINKTWNGTFNGKKSESGVYFYNIQYEDRTGKRVNKTGEINLIY